MLFNKKTYLQELDLLVSNNAVPNNITGLNTNINFILQRLSTLGFEVKKIGGNTNEPILHAIKKSTTSTSKIGIYSHYDVELTNEEKWTTPPTKLTVKEDRLFGRGVADNLGIWLLRMHAIEALEDTVLPEIHWIFQGQEETGSPLAHQVFPSMEIPKIDVWFEETGYFDLGTSRQRFLTLNEDNKVVKAKEICTTLLNDFEFTSYTENRSLTKFDKCPFLTHLIKEQPYLAIGPNDEYSRIHQPNESLSLPLIEKSYYQFQKLLLHYAI